MCRGPARAGPVASLPPEPAIRTLGTLLLVFVLATLVVVAGFAGLANLGQPPLPTARAQELAPLEPPPPATRLPPARPLAQPREAAHSAPHRLERPVGTAVVVVGAGPRPVGLGVAVLDATSGARLAWRELPPDAGELRLTFDAIPVGDHFAVLASHPEQARFSYLARARLAMAADGERVSGQATLDGAVHELRVKLEPAGNDPPRDVLILLARNDDPRWTLPGAPGPAAPATPRWSDANGEVVLYPLGAATYRLQFAGFAPAEAAKPMLVVEVPKTPAVTIPGSLQ